MPQINIIKWDKSKDGELNSPNMGKKLDSQGYKYEVCTYGAGTEFPEHAHGEEKRDCVLSGRFEVKMFDQTVVLEPGDMIDVPKDAKHSAKVVGDEKVVLFDAEKK